MTTKTADAAIVAKPQLSPKDEVRALLDRLPDAVTLEDIRYHLEVVMKVLEAEASRPEQRHTPRGTVRYFEDKMAYHVVWSETARADLDEIEAYWPQDHRLSTRAESLRGFGKLRQVHGFPLLGPHDS